MITEPIALDKSLNTTDQNPKNLADVVQKGLNDIKNAIGGGGGGGGHTIVDSDGQDMPQEDAMQFADAFVSDDDVNGRTVVENVKEVTLAELSQATERGMYLATDEESVPIGEIEKDAVSVTASSDTYRSLINKLRDEIDFSKVTDYSYIKLDGKRFVCTYHDSGELQFTNATAYSPTSSMNTIFIFSTDNGRYYTDTMQNGSAPTVADSSTSSVTDGKTLALYYGTSSTVINLKTSADYCMMSDGVTSVESAHTKEFYGKGTHSSIRSICAGISDDGSRLIFNIPLNIGAGVTSVALSNLTTNAFITKDGIAQRSLTSSTTTINKGYIFVVANINSSISTNIMVMVDITFDLICS